MFRFASTYRAVVHRWLHDVPRILHRDLSPNNIVCRIVNEVTTGGWSERKVYGVLTYYDLSSWKKGLRNDYTKALQQRTGTPPYYMAFELLEAPSAGTHLHRHDLKSFYYIMLLTAAQHMIAPAKGGFSTRGSL